MRDKLAPLIAGLVGIASGIYIFQPVVLEQLDKDGALDPKYQTDAELAKQTFGALVDEPKDAKDPSKGS